MDHVTSRSPATAPAPKRLRDLGPIIVEADGHPLPIKGARPTAILALLAVNADARVSVDTIVDALWHEVVTQARISTVESHIWRLRRILEPERRPGRASSVLVSDGRGYRLVIDPQTFDSSTFESLLVDGVGALSTGRPALALAHLDAALDLWRGKPYAPHSHEEWAEATVARIDELHARASRRRIEALLALGQAGSALADVTLLLQSAPLEETLHVQRLTALARLGRIEEGLTAFRTTRETLLSELGVEPGPELREAHQRILAGHALEQAPTTFQVASAASGIAPTVASQTPPAQRPPRRMTPIVGREGELRQLRELMRHSSLVTIVGPSGCGKTRVAEELAHTLEASYPGGVSFVDLVNGDNPSSALDRTLCTLKTAGPPDDELPPMMRPARKLIVIDNCDHLSPHTKNRIGSLVARAVDCAVLATSCEPLEITGEFTYRLGPLAVPDASLSAAASAETPSVALFRARYRSAHPMTELTDDEILTVGRICVSLRGIPRAIESAAARARVFSLDEIAQEVETRAADPRDHTRRSQN